MESRSRSASPAENYGLLEGKSYNYPVMPSKRRANIVIEIPEWTPKKKNHRRSPLPQALKTTNKGSKLQKKTSPFQKGEIVPREDYVWLPEENFEDDGFEILEGRGIREIQSDLNSDSKDGWSSTNEVASEELDTDGISEAIRDRFVLGPVADGARRIRVQINDHSETMAMIPEDRAMSPTYSHPNSSDNDVLGQESLDQQLEGDHESDIYSLSPEPGMLRNQGPPQLPLEIREPASISTLLFSKPPANLSYECQQLHSLLAIPVFQPEAIVSREDVDWAERVARFDPDLRRFKYSIPGAATILDSDHLLILKEAYAANQQQVDKLRDEDYEFFGVIAEVSPELVKSYFKKRGDLTERIDTGAPSASSGKITSRNPRTPKDSPPIMSKGASDSRSSQKTPSRQQSRLNLADDEKPIIRKHFPKTHQAIQAKTCVSFANGKSEMCKRCTSRQASEICRFRGLRCFYVKSPRDANGSSKYEYGPDFYSDPRTDKKLLFNKAGLGIEESNYILAFIHAHARNLFALEARHVLRASKRIDDPNIKDGRTDYVRRPSTDRLFCERCKISIVSGYWMCCVCAREFCVECFEDEPETTMCTKQRQHRREQFVPCGRFHLSTLQNNVKSLETKINEIPRSLVVDASESQIEPTKKFKPKGTDTKMKYLIPFMLEVEKLTRDKFQANWSRGEVITLSGIDKLMKKDWTLDFLKKNHGGAVGASWKSKSNEYVETTLKEYLESRVVDKMSEGILKLLELPLVPTNVAFQDLYEDLIRALPLPEYTNPGGVFNLSRYFPEGHACVDVCPKLYISQGLEVNSTTDGSIPLSCESFDHIYVCVHTDTFKSSNKIDVSKESSLPGAVVWDIYRAEDCHLLKEYLKYRTRGADPFDGRQCYLTASEQQDLFEQIGVRPFHVVQNLGDAIVIPAGCVWQAYYIQNSILAGVEFVSPERISTTIARQKEARELSLVKKFRRPLDIVMAKDILFYSALAML
ncbi:hypothetical protein BGX27_005814 [Mortierella sp. AM989]|nr:hypothetical protein BGX27_005814 [Mortierella sp. AM989]